MTTTQAPPRATLAAEVCRRYESSPTARSLLRSGQSPQAFFDVLMQQELYDDAVAFLARLLTKPQAVWWGCLCAWDAARPNPSSAVQAALHATLRWLQQPTEEHRRAVEQVARKVGLAKPAGAVAQAAVYAQGSMSPPGLPEVAPPEDLTALTIAGAVCLSAADLTIAGETNAYRQLLRFGLEVAAGKNRWG
jgi:hypothetical protein